MTKKKRPSKVGKAAKCKTPETKSKNPIALPDRPLDRIINFAQEREAKLREAPPDSSRKNTED